MCPIDIAVIDKVISRVPSIEMFTEMAKEIRHHLHLQSNEPGTNNLKQIVEYSHQSKSPLNVEDLVRALMLTPGLGRYVSQLLPFCKFLSVFMITDFLQMDTIP